MEPRRHRSLEPDSLILSYSLGKLIEWKRAKALNWSVLQKRKVGGVYPLKLLSR